MTINNGVKADTLVTACNTCTWPRNGQTYTSSHTVDDALQIAQGCQDTVVLKLTINNGVKTDTLVTACNTYTWPRNEQKNTSKQNVEHRFQNAQGCQDTVVLKLTINNGVKTDTLVTACNTYTWPRNGQTYTSSQTVEHRFQNAQGCQDTVVLKLTINNGVKTDTLVTACNTYTWPR